jgi:hypothetical protein
MCPCPGTSRRSHAPAGRVFGPLVTFARVDRPVIGPGPGYRGRRRAAGEDRRDLGSPGSLKTLRINRFVHQDPQSAAFQDSLQAPRQTVPFPQRRIPMRSRLHCRTADDRGSRGRRQCAADADSYLKGQGPSTVHPSMQRSAPCPVTAGALYLQRLRAGRPGQEVTNGPLTLSAVAI